VSSPLLRGSSASDSEHMSQGIKKQYYVYIRASKRNGTLYIGVTNNLNRRDAEHKTKVSSGFTKKYNVNILVYYEVYDFVEDAIKREKAMKKWNRAWKLELIEKENPDWNDLSSEIAKL
jgi:putative endonuclease